MEKEMAIHSNTKDRILIIFFLIIIFLILYQAFLAASDIQSAQLGTTATTNRFTGTDGKLPDNGKVEEWIFSEKRFFYIAILISVLLGVALPMAPIVAYLRAGWKVKRDEILDGLNPKAQIAYLIMFSSMTVKGSDLTREQILEKFANFYKKWYGRHHFLVPLVLLVPTLLFLCSEVAITAAFRLPWGKANQNAELRQFMLPPIPIAAIAGAYLWVTSDFIYRARRLDFAPSDISWAVLRLVIAVPMGYAFSGIASAGAGSVIAFGLGAFPLSAIQDMLRQSVVKVTTYTPVLTEFNDAVTRLQGIDEEIATRLANEGIKTVPQIAYCDPVRLVMRSNLNFTCITDFMNQALAWIYLQDKLAVMRPFGLRGAAEIADLYEDLKVADKDKRDEAQKKLLSVVAQLGGVFTIELLANVFMQIAEDPYTEFLRLVWIDPFKKEEIEFRDC
jgi:hypothetical protein